MYGSIDAGRSGDNSTANRAEHDRVNEFRRAYNLMLRAFGPQGWWPSETTFETALGAVLTQGTAWTNAERAVDILRGHDALTPEAISRMEGNELARLVRPAGFHTRKARTIKDLVSAVGGSGMGWRALLALDESSLRERLLSIHGVGPETADAIILYCAGLPVFVVDAYTRRFAVRHGLVREDARYEDIQRAFGSHLPADPDLLGEYHALIVELGKMYCGPVARCENCPLKALFDDFQ